MKNYKHHVLLKAILKMERNSPNPEILRITYPEILRSRFFFADLLLH